jgi:hypothetical protein
MFVRKSKKNQAITFIIFDFYESSLFVYRINPYILKNNPKDNKLKAFNRCEKVTKIY